MLTLLTIVLGILTFVMKTEILADVFGQSEGTGRISPYVQAIIDRSNAARYQRR